ncbi:hypothetical protein LEM8419_01596 [Neolewinella maritima]|uniref:HD domain-containing protein n=1 Tax=Neolewinella maritima TaxID=1383882 RepID=A0ABN8F839_9BACT|nr:hypothetical protein [Neolewinella maritima]CAH1000443.1 hypothetical protein LEM8419_01596 [Neolewinella maritima]
MQHPADLVRTAGLMGELQDLKRLQPAHLSHSVATDLFLRAWQHILAGQDVEQVALDTTLRALLNILFPGVDGRFFTVARLDPPAITEVLRTALRRVCDGAVDSVLERQLEQMVPTLAQEFAHLPAEQPIDVPQPLRVLCNQPRAGATHPQLPRLVLSPPEMHSDHCLMTAVYAVVMAHRYGADYGTSFLGALAHHLHNAYLPDCGYAGEICLGAHLQAVIDNCRQEALSHFPTQLRPRILEALYHHERSDTPEGKAISAGDVLDRVIDVKWRTRAAAVTDQDILGELDLVHPGPLKSFQTELLSSTGLWR